MADEANPAQPRLPVGEIIKQSFASPFAHLRTLLRLGWIPAIIFGGVALLYAPLPGYRGGHPEAPPVHFGWSLGAGMLLQIAITISWSVAWMRVALGISESDVKLRFGRREWRYLGRFYGLLLCIYLLIVLVMIGLSIAFFASGAARFASSRVRFGQVSAAVLFFATAGLLIFVFMAFLVRVMLMLPAIASDEYRGLRASWRQTQGYFWRIVIILFITSLPNWFLVSPFVLAAALLRGAALVGPIIGFGAIGVLLSAFLHTALALIYRRLAPEPPSPALVQAQVG